MAAVAGFDFILIDTEHGPADVVALRQHIALASVHGVPVIVRVAEHDTAQVLRILDQGAQGIVAPHLDSAADAAAVVDAAMYPPVGSRGFATYSRAGRFGLTPPEEHSRWFLEHTLLIGMVESPAGVAAVGEIVATPRLDGILVGPADLAASSGPEDPSVGDSIAAVHAELARSGALRMDIVGTRAAAAESFADGAGLVVVNLAHALMAELRGFVAGQR